MTLLQRWVSVCGLPGINMILASSDDGAVYRIYLSETEVRLSLLSLLTLLLPVCL